MMRWARDRDEVLAADAEPWDMPGHRLMRPLPIHSMQRLLAAAGLLFVLSGISGLALASLAGPQARHSWGWTAFHANAIVLGSLCFAVAFGLTPRRFRRIMPALTAVMLAVTPILAMAGLAAAGPSFGIMVLPSIQAPIFAFYVLHLRWAITHAAWVVASFAVVVAVQPGWIGGAANWVFLAGNVVGTGMVVGLMALRSEELATSEGKARASLADLNQTLENRVATQIDEIERLGPLRRFLSPQVASLVIDRDPDEWAHAHRARIAVYFCDLRGFTAFTNSAEPEEVAAVLDAYYNAVGKLIRQYDATVGDYAGDGIMAYFGDPVPRQDAAAAAVAMSLDARTAMLPLVAEWTRLGYDLHFGAGVAYGYATLGAIGFDGRYDYKPIGGVVNLAARLCAAATRGQLLVDHATQADIAGWFTSQPAGELTLKGYAGPVRSYEVTGHVDRSRPRIP